MDEMMWKQMYLRLAGAVAVGLLAFRKKEIK